MPVCGIQEGKVLNAADLGPEWELAKYQTRVRSLLVPNPVKIRSAIAFNFGVFGTALHQDKWIRAESF